MDGDERNEKTKKNPNCHRRKRMHRSTKPKKRAPFVAPNKAIIQMESANLVNGCPANPPWPREAPAHVPVGGRMGDYEKKCQPTCLACDWRLAMNRGPEGSYVKRCQSAMWYPSLIVDFAAFFVPVLFVGSNPLVSGDQSPGGVGFSNKLYSVLINLTNLIGNSIR